MRICFTMKLFVTIVSVLVSYAVALGAYRPQTSNDMILFRDGHKIEVKITQVAKDQIFYKLSSKKDAPEISVDLSEAYMIKFASRGNVYITPDGKRVTGENQKIDKLADVIYLVSCKEIQAFYPKVGTDIITYQISPTVKKGHTPIIDAVPLSDVFMIEYADGTRDIITDLSNAVMPKTQVVIPEETKAEEPVQKPTLKVVFHTAKSGDTLASVAERYGVTPEEIIEWNELPAKTRTTARLKTGMELMLYVEPAE